MDKSYLVRYTSYVLFFVHFETVLTDAFLKVCDTDNAEHAIE